MKNTMITKPTIDLLKDMRCYWLDFVLYSGRKRLNPEDIGTTAEQLPPDVIANLGSKRIINPEQLKVFTAIKSRAVTLLDRTGVRFLGCWLIPETKVLEVEKALKQIQNDFDSAKTNFLQNYETNIQDWISAHTGYEAMLQNAVDSPQYVERRLQFGFYSFRFAKAQNASFKEAVGEVANTLYDDIAKDASEMWRDTFAGRSELTKKSLSPLRTLKAKLDGLTLIEPHISPLANLIGAVLEKVNNTPITGVDVLTVQGLVLLLKNQEAAITYAQRMLDGYCTDKLISSLLKASSGKPETSFAQEAEEEEEKQAAYTTEVIPDAQQRFHISSCGLW